MAGLTVKETADLLRFDVGTIRTYIIRGKIKKQKSGHHVRIHREDNEEFFANREKVLAELGEAQTS